MRFAWRLMLARSQYAEVQEMSTRCPKCSYIRRPIDDIIPDYECPRCGVIYAKAANSQHPSSVASAEPEGQPTKDLHSVSMVVKASMGSIEVKDGQFRIKKKWSNDTVISVEEISGINVVEPHILAQGYLHIATFNNPSPLNNRISAGSHPQCLVFNLDHTSAVQDLVEAIRAYLAANPPEARHPKGKAAANAVMKLDVLPEKTRRVYDEHVGAHDVRFVIMGTFGQAIVALTDRAVVVKAGFMAGATGGGRATSFNYTDIVGIEINTGWLSAVIEIVTAGHTGTPQHDWWEMGKDRDPAKLSNTLPLTKDLLEKQKHDVERLRGLIDKAKPHAVAATEAASRDVASQLQDLAELHAKGILSDEEFAQAKKKILNPGS